MVSSDRPYSVASFGILLINTEYPSAPIMARFSVVESGTIRLK